MKRKISKIGNSLGVIIPSSFFEEMGLSHQDYVNISYNSDLEMITITKDSTTPSTKLEQIVKNVVDNYLKEKGL